ncbi:MAG: lipoprotein-releasing ABC transporter permease subunit [Steroidobacteraceae bacterium]
MFHPLSLFVGLRYVRSRSHRFFVSFITWVSVLGVAVGVAALIVILSVMNGLGGELRSRLLSLAAQVRVNAASGAPAPDWEAVASRLRAVPGVSGASVYAELQALAVRQTEMLPVLLRGVPAVAGERSVLADVMSEGSAEPLSERADAIVLGQVIANQLGVGVGDTLTLLVPRIGDGGVPDGALREFYVAGLFEAGLPDHDATLAIASLDTLTSLGALRSGVAGVRLTTADPLQVPQMRPAFEAAAGPGLVVRDWTQDHATYFRAVRIEKTMMAVILLLIVAVAAFNLVAMLVMVVNDKRTDVAILRTLGARPGEVSAAFLTQGLVIGWAGVIAGVVTGILIAINVPELAPLIERLFGFQIMDADVYYISRIPSDLQWGDVAIISVVALALTTLATVYPAHRAARIPPAEALRYE